MSKKEKILAEALSLPAKQRAILADDLWFSLDRLTQAQIDRAWFREIRRRWAECERGESETIDGEEAMRRAYQAISEKKVKPRPNKQPRSGVRR